MSEVSSPASAVSQDVDGGAEVSVWDLEQVEELAHQDGTFLSLVEL